MKKRRLSATDREAIAAAVEALVALDPRVSPNIVDIQVRGQEVTVRTGRRDGPRSGVGQVLRLHETETGWRAEAIGFWRS